MGEIVRYPLAQGGEVLVEIEDESGLRRAGHGERITQAKETFNAAFGQVRAAASTALATFTTMPTGPDEVELKFGVKLDAEAGAVIAKTGMQAQFEVKLKWLGGQVDRPIEESADEASRSTAADGGGHSVDEPRHGDLAG